MDLKSLPLFSALQEKMSWLNRRQVVLAENLANANTPGYKPHDIKEPDFKGLMSQYSKHSVALKTTQPGHMSGANATVLTSTNSGSSLGSSSDGKIRVKPQETQPNGNGVSVENEMVKMTQSQIDYNTLLGIYRKHVGMINTVLGKGH